MGDNDSQQGPQTGVTSTPQARQRDVDELRDRVRNSPAHSRDLERQVQELRSSQRVLSAQNARLVDTLKDARGQIIELRGEIERLVQPPNSFGVVVQVLADHEVDVLTGGRRMRVLANKEIDRAELAEGRLVVLNEALNVVKIADYERHGDIVAVKELLGDDRVVTVSRSDDEKVCVVAQSLRGTGIRVGDAVMVDARTGFVIERIQRAEVAELVLEEVPDISYSDIGGLSGQIELIRDAVELPYLHPELYREHALKPPKGVLLYGPPGCGKTLIAKAVAASLAQQVALKTGVAAEKSYFLNIKGPELLNKYVGETERHIRLIFERAREKASDGTPVVVFFDEMDSLFRTRGSGVSSDVETTIVPQLLAEIDGVERLENVVVIGASNREDMIDPAILRPGRLDVKIKIERPDAPAAADIFGKYLTPAVPLHADELARNGGSAQAVIAEMISTTVARMYSLDERNKFLEVTYAGGDKEILYFKDFSSGAMIQNIVDRAKKSAIKDLLASGQRGLRMRHLLEACDDEFRENEDLPNTTNPDDWARVSGKKGERIVYIRTLVQGDSGTAPGKSIASVSADSRFL